MAVSNEQIASAVLAAVGGKDNISLVTHCMTRLRFNLKDQGIPNEEEIKKINGVIGVVVAGGQFQIIVGQNVPKVYSALCKEAGISEQAAIHENLDAPKEKLTPRKVGSNILGYLSGSMTPLIPVIMAAAMFKTVQVLLGPSILGIISETNDLYLLCGFMYSAFFYFLPIFLGYTASKKLGLNPALGIMACALLLVPDFMTLVTEGTRFTVYGIPVMLNDYSQSVLPAILTVWVLNYIYKFFNKILPDILQTIFAPFLSLVVLAPFELCLLAPLGAMIGNVLGNILVAFGNHGGFLAVAVVSALWEFLVMTGMHSVLGVVSITALMTYGVESFITPSAYCATWAAFGMALGAFLRIRQKEEKSLSLGYFVSGILGGVTEPALYGLGFRYKRPFIPLMIGGFCGGLYAGITHVGAYAMGATNFLSVLIYVPGGVSNTVNGCISCAIAFIVTTIFTYFIGFSKKDLEGTEVAA